MITATLPKRVSIYEVGPRDGLQNELRTLSTEDKLRMVEALIEAGLKRIEITSFVSPRWIPQLADADRLLSLVRRREGVVFSALVPNLKGLERAKAAQLEEAAVFLSVTESHSRKNINKSVDEAVRTASEVAREARAAGMRVRCYLSTVWGCPYEGLTPVSKVVEVGRGLTEVGFYQLSLGDTIGVGTPTQTAEIVGEVSDEHDRSRAGVVQGRDSVTFPGELRPDELLGRTGVRVGVTTYDSSIGGLGGCPYAPGAAGNLSTEDLAYMLEGMGVDTGVKLGALVDAGALGQELIGRKLPGKYLQAALGEREKLASRRGA